MRVEWKGGQLDGAVDDIDDPEEIWMGPDASEPVSKVVVYELIRKKDSAEYRYNQKLTDNANPDNPDTTKAD